MILNASRNITEPFTLFVCIIGWRSHSCRQSIWKAVNLGEYKTAFRWEGGEVWTCILLIDLLWCRYSKCKGNTLRLKHFRENLKICNNSLYIFFYNNAFRREVGEVWTRIVLIPIFFHADIQNITVTPADLNILSENLGRFLEDSR